MTLARKLLGGALITTSLIVGTLAKDAIKHHESRGIQAPKELIAVGYTIPTLMTAIPGAYLLFRRPREEYQQQ